jgi:hypothetical protein
MIEQKKSKDSLLEPLQIKRVVLKNRIMSTSYACGLEQGGLPQDKYQSYHEEKARGGIALSMFCESSNVAIDSPSIFQQLNVGKDNIIPHLQQFSERMHALGGCFNVPNYPFGSTKMRVHDYCSGWSQLRSESVGSVDLQSSDPLASPRVKHNYLVEESDWAFNSCAFDMALELRQQAAFAPFREKELDPSKACDNRDAIDQYIRDTYHIHFLPVGTAAMGSDGMAVISDQLQVHGVDNSIVVVVLIIPCLVGANTNIPTIMIAEKVSAMIKTH